MKIGKIAIAAVALTVFNAVVGFVACGWLFRWVYNIEPVSVWKSMNAPGVTYYVGTVVLNVIFVVVYALLRKGIPGKHNVTKGVMYGLFVWAIGVLPGMFATYIFMTVAPAVIVYWLILALFVDPLKGLIAATIYGE